MLKYIGSEEQLKEHGFEKTYSSFTKIFKREFNNGEVRILCELVVLYDTQKAIILRSIHLSNEPALETLYDLFKAGLIEKAD